MEEIVIKKTPLSSGKKVKVTFELKPNSGAEAISLVGDFNGWSREATPMKLRKKDGVFAASLTLPVSQTFQFRYWIDDRRWENDWAADDYVPNGYGEDNSVVHT